MTLTLDSSYWNNRYQQNETGWDIGAVSTPLKEYFDQLTDKSRRILIPGAGNAWEAQYLMEKGFKNVVVCDIAEAPLENLRERCAGLKPDQLLLEDFFDLQGEYDLIIEQTFFCALNPSLRHTYFEKAYSLLKPGGKLTGLLFNDVLNNDKPPFGGSRDEYQIYFKNLFEPLVFETCCNSIKPRENRELFMILKKPTP